MPKLNMRLVREPQSLERMSPEIRKQVRIGYNALGSTMIAKFAAKVQNWDVRPNFAYKVTVSRKKYTLTFRYDGRTKGGQIFEWVDQGTGKYREDGKGTEYTIKAKKGVLWYELPNPMPKTKAYDGSLAKSYTAPPGVVKKKAVRHPGIKPRKLLAEEIDLLESRRSGSFHNTTEAAIKRGLRRMGRHT